MFCFLNVRDVGGNKSQNKIYLDEVISSYVFCTNVVTFFIFFKKNLAFSEQEKWERKGVAESAPIGDSSSLATSGHGSWRGRKGTLGHTTRGGLFNFLFSFSSFESMGKGKKFLWK